MLSFERPWGRIKMKLLRIVKAEIEELYVPGSGGAMVKVTATAEQINALSSTPVADNSITNAKMAADAKVGSLAALTTSARTSLQAAINELVTSIGLKYTKPGTGIPKTDFAAAVQASLDLADTALQLEAGIERFARKTIQLAGGVTPVLFQDDAAPFITGIDAPVDMSTPGNNGTIKLTYDAQAEETATLNCAAANWTGGTSAKTDMSGDADTKFMIAMDGGEAVEVTCDWTGAVTGNDVAAAMQLAIRAATSGLETVAFSVNKYIITSTKLGTGSRVVITRAEAGNCTEELDIGPDGGAETAGTGDCADVTAVTPAEIATLINGDMARVDADASSGTLIISGAGTGRTHKVTAGNGTLNTLCGIPNTEVGYGAQGMGLEADWENATYDVLLTYKGAAAASKDLAWASPTTAGFNVTCETGSDTGYVSVLVVG